MDEPACGSGSTPKEQLTDQEEGEETRGNGRKGHRSVMRRLCSRFLSFPSCRVRPRANVFVKLCDAAEVELGCGGGTHNPSIANASSTVSRLSPFAPVSFLSLDFLSCYILLLLLIRYISAEFFG